MGRSAEVTVHLRTPGPQQRPFLDSPAKRKMIRAGRRGGKTVGVSILAARAFLREERVLYAVPTNDQLTRFWFEIKRAFDEPLRAGMLIKNETEHYIERPGTLQRIRGKTAWNADTLRGDFADLLILDEYQLMSEDAWALVGAPMLLDNNGDAVFVYTPPSLRTRSMSKAVDKMHAAKLYKRLAADRSGRSAVFHFSSHDNPTLSAEALREITQDMTRLAYEQEILALDKEDNPGALWKRQTIEDNRVLAAPELELVVVGVDPTASSDGDEAGIVTDGRARIGKFKHLFVLADDSTGGSPRTWGEAAVRAYHRHRANKIVAEKNNGGEMVATVIHQVDPSVPVELVWASRGKDTRAEPISALYEPGVENGAPPRGHHVGVFSDLEDEMCQWQPGMPSPNRMDAHVWASTKLMLGSSGWASGSAG